MTYQEVLSIIQKELSGLSNGDNEARWMIRSVLGEEFSPQRDALQKIPKADFDRMMNMVSKRKESYPLEYLLGTVDFLGQTFHVCDDVLIPREDSGVLIEYLINNAPVGASVLEIGVGTGILSLSLKKERRDLNILAIDNNPKAITCSKNNERRIFGEQGHIAFSECDFLQTRWENPFDIVLSNPPYLNEQEYQEAQKELHFEPKGALVGGADGLLFYLEILRRKEELVKLGGQIVLEISPPRWKQIQGMIDGHDNFQILYDLHGLERGLVMTRNS